MKAPSIESLVAGLSGGNQQKIALAKWLARSCDILLIDEPTRGVDVGAKAEIYPLLDELAISEQAQVVHARRHPTLVAFQTELSAVARNFHCHLHRVGLRSSGTAR